MSNTIVGCKLPHGLIVQGLNGRQVTLNGQKTSHIPGGYGVTVLDADEAAYIFAMYEQHAAFQNRAVFSPESEKVSDIAALARDLESIPTGLEGLNADKPGGGLVPADPAALDKALDKARANQRPAIAPKSKADKEAANQVRDAS